MGRAGRLCVSNIHNFFHSDYLPCYRCVRDVGGAGVCCDWLGGWVGAYPAANTVNARSQGSSTSRSPSLLSLLCALCRRITPTMVERHGKAAPALPMHTLRPHHAEPAVCAAQEYANDYGTEEEQRIARELIAKEAQIGLSESAKVCLRVC